MTTGKTFAPTRKGARTRPLFLVLALALTTGCYQTIGGGYANKFAGDPIDRTGSHGGRIHYVLASDDAIKAEGGGASIHGKIDLQIGEYGVRASDAFGVMWTQALSSHVRGFVRPSLDLVVLGVEEPPAGQKAGDPFVGIGADVEGGVLFDAGGPLIEVGLQLGGDVGYTGQGTGAYLALFVGFGWLTDWKMDLVTD